MSHHERPNPPSFPPPPEAVLKKLERKILELRKKTYLPEAMINVVVAVARLHLGAEPLVRFDGMREQVLPEGIVKKTASADTRALGAVLLPREEFPLDRETAAKLLPAVLHIITEHASELAPFAAQLEADLASGRYSLDAACREILAAGSVKPATETPRGKTPSGLSAPGGDAAGEPAAASAAGQARGSNSCFTDWENRFPEAPLFFHFVVQSAVMPSVTTAARILGQLHRDDVMWPHGHCPVCGSHPLMGRLAGDEGIRMHTCSFCSFEYRVPRIGCPFCLSAEHDGTEYYSSEDEPGYSLSVCNACANYLKIADFRQFDRVWMPLLDDLSSLALDLYARQMGYSRPTLSAWGF